MKKTLYEILGVAPDASTEAIKRAYQDRFAVLSVSTTHDPNELVVLKQAADVLSDTQQRAAYDAAHSAGAHPALRVDDEEDEPGFLQVWGKWLVGGIAVLGVVYWMSHRTPPAPPPPAPQTANAPVADAIRSADSAATEPAPAVAAAPVPPPAAPAPSAPPQQEVAVVNSPIVGIWSCFDPVSGRTGNYNFRADGTLIVDAGSGGTGAPKYQIAGGTIKLLEGAQADTWVIEQMGEHKMVLNTGTQGHRLACSR